MSKLLSYFAEQIVEHSGSEKNPVLEVSMVSGSYMLNTQNGNYSFGSLHKIFEEAFYKARIRKKHFKNILVLGYGAGSVVHLLRNKYKQEGSIVAVEYDEKVLELGARYFNSDKYEAVKIVCADAYQFVMEAKESYDLIVIDLYDDLDVPPQFETSDFISAVCSLLNPLGMLFFNKVVMNAEHKRAYKLAEAEYQKYGSSETYVLMEMNYMLALTRTINE